MKSVKRVQVIRFFVGAAVAVCLSASSAFALVVPDAECPCNPTPIMHAPECGYDFVCNRTDGPPQLTNPGTLTNPTGQILTCNTCCPDCDCENPPTLTHLCQQTISISLTRTITVTIATGIQAGVPGLEATLEQSFSFGGALSKTFQVSAGSSSFPSCQIGQYTVSVAVRVGATYAISSTYSWSTVLVVGTIPPCGGGGPLNNCFGARTSTATGDEWGSASMNWLGNSNCP